MFICAVIAAQGFARAFAQPSRVDSKLQPRSRRMTPNIGGPTTAARRLFLTLLLLAIPSTLCQAKLNSSAGEALESKQSRDCPSHWSPSVRIVEAGVTANKLVTLRLVDSSRDFLHSSERSGSDGNNGGRKIEPAHVPLCFYQGNVEGEDGLAVAKQRNGQISGSFHFGGRSYEIPEQPMDAAAPLSARRMPPSPHKQGCGLATKAAAGVGAESDADAQRRHHAEHERHSRTLKFDTQSTFTETTRKYIQLILVGDQYFYAKWGSSLDQAKERLWEVGNYVNALYKQLGVNVITVYTEVWTKDRYTLTSANNRYGADANEMLNQFMIYRMRSLSSKAHSAAHLISGLKFFGNGNLGLAKISKLCTFCCASGVNSDQALNAYGVSVTVAHELGHNLGLKHDQEEQNCFCPDSQGCIMGAVSVAGQEPIRFSSCSVRRFKQMSVPNGLGYCMSDPPEDSALDDKKATCGNRIVEAGEDCDCGPPKWCNSTCCNPSTCRFASGASCASGECCNRATCTLMTQGTVCRTSRGSCDLPEYCNGSSEWCPQFDDYKVDGTECLTGKAYCYKGKCNDRDSRCAAIFNFAGVRAAPASSSVVNTGGKEYGYCSYVETSVDPITYELAACTLENQRCGLLYCVAEAVSTSLKNVAWKGGMSIGSVSGHIGGADIGKIAYARLDLRPSGYRDPGMVPNGAECGANMMCVDSQCVSTAPKVRCPNCNGRGDCAQSGVCFCQAGFRPPDCARAGRGGSWTNRLPDQKSLACPRTVQVNWWLIAGSPLFLIGFIAACQ